jgi:peroxiredoxin Q/BCP
MANNLNFPLLSDENGIIAKKFAVPLKKGASIEKTIDGNQVTLTRGVTAARWIFIIDKEGKIVHKDTQVKAVESSKNVIAFLKNLNKGN